ncbi:MAG TPA: hypothetical protein VN132_04020 [Bdellovibrio sp.]|nr:hypothetical protein [Bdellovibrio sp.]
MKKKTLIHSVAIIALLTGASAFAETYQCGAHTVITDAESGISVNGVRLRSVGRGYYSGNGYTFTFNEHYENGAVVSSPILIANGEEIPCR